MKIATEDGENQNITSFLEMLDWVGQDSRISEEKIVEEHRKWFQWWSPLIDRGFRVSGWRRRNGERGTGNSWSPCALHFQLRRGDSSMSEPNHTGGRDKTGISSSWNSGRGWFLGEYWKVETPKIDFSILLDFSNFYISWLATERVFQSTKECVIWTLYAIVMEDQSVF